MARLTRARPSDAQPGDADPQPGDDASAVEPAGTADAEAPAEAVDPADPVDADADADADTEVDADPEADDADTEVDDADDAEVDGTVTEVDADPEVDDADDAELEAGADVGDDADVGSGGGTGRGDEPAAPRPGGPAWRDRRMIVAAAVAVVSLSLAAVLAFTSRSGGGDGGGEDAASAPGTPSTSMVSGGIDVPTPEGWGAAPIPRLGFGIAYPPGWEVVVLEPEMLNSLTRSDPQVTGLVEAAHAAAEQGFVFYAAGEDGDGRVTDLKIGAVPGTGVTDLAGLEDYARRTAAAQPGVTGAASEPVEGADRPTVRTRFRSTSQSEDGQRIATTGVETLVLGPDDVVWSLIVTGEDRALVDEIVPRLLDTFVLVER